MVEFLGARPLESGATTEWDWVPQVQISINQRQHLLFNVGVRLQLTNRNSRNPQISAYFLWDWFDGGLGEGWQRLGLQEFSRTPVTLARSCQ